MHTSYIFMHILWIKACSGSGAPSGGELLPKTHLFENLCKFMILLCFLWSEWGVSTHVLFYPWAWWDWGLDNWKSLSSSSAPRTILKEYTKTTKIHNLSNTYFFFEGEKSPCGHVGSHYILVRSQKIHTFSKKVAFFEGEKAPAGAWVVTPYL